MGSFLIFPSQEFLNCALKGTDSYSFFIMFFLPSCIHMEYILLSKPASLPKCQCVL